MSESKFKIISTQPAYLKNLLTVELLEGEWPSDRELLEKYDYPLGAPFGGSVNKYERDGRQFADIAIYTD